MLKGMIGSHPALGTVMQMCNGKDPQQVFYAECSRRGIDPKSILSQLGIQ